jgi:tRNA (uracil-5-)-methyltransferase
VVCELVIVLFCVLTLRKLGHGLARAPGKLPWVIIIPFCLPGETVRARIYRNQRLHSLADLVEVLTPNLELRDDTRVQCRYFTKCGGCQYQVGCTLVIIGIVDLRVFQMLSYEKQLELKRDVVVKAFRNYSSMTHHLPFPYI